MPRTRAVLSDLDRAEISRTLFDAQVLHDETSRILADRVRRHVHQAKAAQRAQERLTAAEMREERQNWDGFKCRRRNERRGSQVAA